MINKTEIEVNCTVSHFCELEAKVMRTNNHAQRVLAHITDTYNLICEKDVDVSEWTKESNDDIPVNRIMGVIDTLERITKKLNDIGSKTTDIRDLFK